MKAVVLAGGDGLRLRPITAHSPKPMLEIGRRPALEHLIALLAKHGFSEIMLTLRYKPEAVISHFGISKCGAEYDTGAGIVSLSYNVESTPRGTAGSVADIIDFADGESFLIVSGDCLTDIDLGAVMNRHLFSGADVTIALTKCDSPTEYGLVVTDDESRVRNFCEKPPWEGVLTDSINTGIYAIKPHCFLGVPETGKYDFACDLFPELMKENADIRGYYTEGYWVDFGSPESYMKANADAESGAVRLYSKPPEIMFPGKTGKNNFFTSITDSNAAVSGIEFSHPGIITCIPGSSVKYDVLFRLGQAVSSFGKSIVSYSGASLARTVTTTIISGINAGGGDALLCDAHLLSAAKYIAGVYDCKMNIFISQRGQSVRIHLFTADGVPVSNLYERQIKQGIRSPVSTTIPGETKIVQGTLGGYTAWVRRNAHFTDFSANGFSAGGGGESAQVLRQVFGQNREEGDSRDFDKCSDVPPTAADTALAAVFYPDPDGLSVSAVTQGGLHLDSSHMTALGTLIALRCSNAPIVLPSDAPNAAIMLCESYMRPYKLDDKEAARWAGDGILLAAIVAAYSNEKNLPLDMLAKELPHFAMLKRTVSVYGGRGAVMRALTRSPDFEFASEIGVGFKTGVVYKKGGGTVRICPSREGEDLQITTEAASEKEALLLTDEVSKRIASL